MESKRSGYGSKEYPFPTKRYYQCLDLVHDPDKIAEYIKIHSREGHWPIINEGIKSVGILEMELFLFENRLFMVVVTKEDFDWDTAFAKLANSSETSRMGIFCRSFSVL